MAGRQIPDRLPWDLQAFEKVMFMDARNPEHNLQALLNPVELTVATNVNVGKLNPIGSTHPTQQYGYTEESAFSLTLDYSYLLYHEFGLDFYGLK